MGHSARMAEMQRFPDNGRERDTSAHLHAIPSNTDRLRISSSRS